MLSVSQPPHCAEDATAGSARLDISVGLEDTNDAIDGHGYSDLYVGSGAFVCEDVASVRSSGGVGS